MRRALLLALGVAACSSNQNGPLPVIESFTVDDPNPEVGAPVHLSYSVTGATDGIGIYPVPGAVYGSPVTVVPPGSVVFSLRAFSKAGVVSRDLAVNVRPALPLAINATDATPGQVAPGAAVTLSWSTTSAGRATLTDGATGAVSDVPESGAQVVHPAATTVYTLTAYNKPGRSPPSLTARITARVAMPPSVSSFIAAPQSITQGDASKLSWTGTATAYSVSDGATTIPLGPRRELVVRPAATTTYTLHAVGPAGDFSHPPSTTVTVDPHPGATLSYTPPAGGALQLLAEPCPAPCASVTLRIRATSAVQLRGAALDLPLDVTKASLDGGSVTSPVPGAIIRAVMGSGPLRDVLVLGFALAGDGTAPAADITLGPGDDLAAFSLTLLPAGGRGPVFDGFVLAAASGVAYKASVQRASGRVANAIAVGKLEAQ